LFATSAGSLVYGATNDWSPVMRLLVPCLALSACVFPMADNGQHVARLCNDQNYAYETGYNRGLKRSPMDTTWVDTSCAPEVRPRIRAAYQGGYQSGIEHAPLVVPVGGGGGGYSVAERCTFSSDCGEGRTCRSNQCMGNGYAGDACWFSSDCLSGSCEHKVCR
jgi:hypothetical protein